MKLFFELFKPVMGNRYLLVTTTVDDIANGLYEKIKEVDGKFFISIYGEGEFNGAKVELIDSFSKPFKSPPRDKDSIVLYDVVSKHKIPKMLLKYSYTALANAAEIVIVEKKNSLDIEKIKKLLDECEFRAVNHIKDLLDGYDVITAKKMHMWGNGL